MTGEEALRSCICNLNQVTGVFRDLRQGLEAPTKYEADFAALRLTNITWQHVNSISGVATMPFVGSHLISAWVLARAAYETGITALWLTEPDDWKAREARWLRWVHREEKHRGRMANEFRPINQAMAERSDADVRTYANKREAISKLLLKEIVSSSDEGLHKEVAAALNKATELKFDKIVEETSYGRALYAAYRLSSHSLHGGPSVLDESVEIIADRFNMVKDDPKAWSTLLKMASWSIAVSGQHCLLRCGRTQDEVKPLLRAHEELLEAVTVLENSQ